MGRVAARTGGRVDAPSLRRRRAGRRVDPAHARPPRRRTRQARFVASTRALRRRAPPPVRPAANLLRPPRRPLGASESKEVELGRRDVITGFL